MNKREMVDHPSHYGGKDNPYECIKVIKAWGFYNDFLLGTAIRYINRCGKKDLKGDQLASEIEDLQKAQWYISVKIEDLQAHQEAEAYQD